MTKFSIMIPVYNKKEYLEQYLCYVLSQSYNDYEIVIVDDCSTDGSYEYLLDVSKQYSNVKLYKNNKNLGLGLTRNRLLECSEGEYVIFVDPDDVVDYRLLEKVNDNLSDDIDIIRFQNISIPATKRQWKLEKNKNPLRFSCEPEDSITGEEAILKWCMGPEKINTMPWTYCMKKTLYEGVEYPNTSVLEDFAITPYLLAKAKKIRAIDFIGYFYLQYDNSLTKTDSNIKAQYEFAKTKLYIFKDIIKLTKKNINLSDISDDTKERFLEDVIKRYQIREQRLSLLEEKLNKSKGVN